MRSSVAAWVETKEAKKYPASSMQKETCSVTRFIHCVAASFLLILPGALTGTAAPPEVTAQPQSRVATNGATVALTVAASGSLPLTFQWKKEGLDLVSQTESNLVLTNVSSNDSGNYS